MRTWSCKISLKKTRVKLDSSTDIDMLLMAEKGIKEGRYQYWNVNNLYGWVRFQKFYVNSFEWIKHTSQFNKDFIKNLNEEKDERYFLEFDVQYLEKLHKLYNNLPFLPERMKIEQVEKLVVI